MTIPPALCNQAPLFRGTDLLTMPDDADAEARDRAVRQRVLEEQLPDADLTVRRQYRELIEELARRIGGRRRGWQRRVASILGVSASTISNVLTKDVVVRDETLLRAQKRLDLPRSYFFHSGTLPGEYLGNATAAHAIAAARGHREARDLALDERPALRPPPVMKSDVVPGVVALHRWLLDRAIRSGATGGIAFDAASDDDLALEFAHEMRAKLGFVRDAIALLDDATHPDTKRVLSSRLVQDFVTEFAFLRVWFQLHPGEPTLRDVLEAEAAVAEKKSG